MVLGSMRAVYEEHQSLVGTEADDPHVRTAWRRAHLARAKPIAKMGHVMRAEILIGSEIRNLEDEKLRSEEHTSELQSLMRISYAVFCLKKKKQPQIHKAN